MEVVRVGVTTRRRAFDLAVAERSGTAKRRKIRGGEMEFSALPANSVSPAMSENSGRRPTVSNDRYSGPSSDNDPASCCSSNTASDLEKGSLKIVDLEDDNVQLETSTCVLDCSKSRETSLPAGSGELDSTATSSEVNSRRRSQAKEMPSEAELEEFFASTEKEHQKQFAEKYNFDIAKDKPLEGRFEWVRLKP
ncbi:hypothetical protein NMG60_11026071 [Bertholletia excelsa]